MICLNLGIVVDAAGNIVSHRSLLKVVINPLIRIIGWQIATVFDDINGNNGAVDIKLKMVKCERRFSIAGWLYRLRDDEMLVPVRRFI